MVALAVGLVLSSGGGETAVERAAGAVHLTYRVDPPGATPAGRAAKVLLARLTHAGIGDAQVSVADGGAAVGVDVPAADQDAVAALTRPGRLAIYDAERGTPEDPALTAADVASAKVALDQGTREPVVQLEFTPQGEQRFTALTRRLARRGSSVEAWQHLAMAVDGDVLSRPFIDYRQAPDGIDGAEGTRISDRFTEQAARTWRPSWTSARSPPR